MSAADIMSEDNINPLVDFVAHAFYYLPRLGPELSLYSHLLVSALFPIWIAAHAALSRPSSAAKPPKKSDKDYDEDSDDEEGEDEEGPVEKLEGLQPSDALMFPLTAGFTLCSLYAALKWLKDPSIVNKILGFYFSQMGMFFVVAFLKDILLFGRSFIFPKYYRHQGRIFHAKQSERVFKTKTADEVNSPGHVRNSPLPGVFSRVPLPGFVLNQLWACRNASYQQLRLRFHIRGLFNIKPLVGLLDLLSVTVALVAVAYFQFVEKPWWLTNFLGFSFSYGTMQLMSPTTFGTGSLILTSLFFYDIYFVFFTPVMVHVAKNLDVPIKLMFPRTDETGEPAHAMLGLGDIVIPGMMVCLALRFDLFLYYRLKGAQKAKIAGLDGEIAKPEYQRATGLWGERFWAPSVRAKEPEVKPPYHDARAFPKVYFTASLVGYVAGMIATLMVMQKFNHAQPALLYLVPGILISLWGTALARGEVRLMLDFSDAEEDEEEEGEEKKGSDKKLTDAEAEPAKDGVKGLFMRILSGAPTVFSSKSEQKKEDANEKTESEEAKASKTKESAADQSKAKNAEDDLDLITFSISFPGKKHAKRGIDYDENPTKDEGLVMIPGPIDDNDERPLKKRRGTPRRPTLE
ncbi:Peptidase A22B signal peptide peptidase [Penicillium tannophilum]|nr:Peptidase A22B signal peptide peptidase [Penicillium tannophilum]